MKANMESDIASKVHHLIWTECYEKPLIPGWKSYILWKLGGLKALRKKGSDVSTRPLQTAYLPFIRHDSALFHVTTIVLPCRQFEHFQTSTQANFPFPRRCASNNS